MSQVYPIPNLTSRDLEDSFVRERRVAGRCIEARDGLP